MRICISVGLGDFNANREHRFSSTHGPFTNMAVINHPFTNLNGATVEILKSITYSAPDILMDVITSPWWISS